MNKLVIHWFFLLMILFISALINIIIVYGHRNNTLLQTNVSCNVVNEHLNSDNKIALNVKCGSITNDIDDQYIIMEIIKSKTNTILCDIYESESFVCKIKDM